MAERHAILQSRALNTLLDKENRVSVFTDGYGDFCFAPGEPFKCFECEGLLPFRRPSSTTPIVERTQSLSISDYASSLRISFLALPKDIRDIIYAYWLLPFRNPLFGGSIKVEMGVVHSRRCHPFRSGYDVRVSSTIITTRKRISREKEHFHVARTDYAQLHALSQVSHKIREELGALFWRDVYVDMDHWEYLFLDFLDDRPAIWNGIKKLRMDWSCEESATSLNEGWGAIVDFCKAIVPRLQLDELVCVLNSNPRVVREILAQGETLAWVQAFKKIRVKKLTMDLFLIPESDDERDDISLGSDGSDDDDDDNDNDDDYDSNHSLEPDLINDSDSAVSENDGPSADEDDSDSSSSSSSSNESEDSMTSEERLHMLRNQWNPLLEQLLGPPRPPPSEVTAEDEYLAERRALDRRG